MFNNQAIHFESSATLFRSMHYVHNWISTRQLYGRKMSCIRTGVAGFSPYTISHNARTVQFNDRFVQSAECFSVFVCIYGKPSTRCTRADITYEFSRVHTEPAAKHTQNTACSQATATLCSMHGHHCHRIYFAYVYIYAYIEYNNMYSSLYRCTTLHSDVSTEKSYF